MKQVNQIFMANSAYSLFTFLLMFPDKVNSTLFVTGPAIKDAALPLKLVFDVPSKEMSERDIRKYQSDLMVDVNHSLGGRIVPCYGNANTPYAQGFVNAYPFYALSDGLSDYDRFPAYYQDDSIYECYSTGDIIGDKTDKKLKLFDVQALWNGLSKQNREKIAAIFSLSAEDLNTAASRSVVLITQPLSEDNMLSESEKVDLYTRIINVYGAENVVMKPHPREKTNWHTLFPDMPVIPRQIPVELLTKLVDLNRVATFFSTAAFGSVPDEKIDFYSEGFGDLKAFHPGEMRLDASTGREMKSVAVSDIEQTYRASKKCNWKRIPDMDGHFYHAPMTLDEAGIPVNMAPSCVRKALSVRDSLKDLGQTDQARTRA